MKTEIICFSATGMETALAIAAGLGQEANCTLWVKSKYVNADSRFQTVQERLPEWTASHWGRELLVFVFNKPKLLASFLMIYLFS